ncbi:hypothetical protein [Pelagovum pacificum]|uniref:DUF2029 domain-containing protein n=1 Tax=Pelagovum pacificum TaxID=2588711 RepID=A0A5C5GEF8_9RHOB|nr:hypothetical protein [Pelagovum pacificum]QQA43762.1 hypothetical protein I8N54_04070 [Pelagovum pacificum]TNY33108.1 hypothetical protein FHY64_07465 [Pelagovum pacificum]
MRHPAYYTAIVVAAFWAACWLLFAHQSAPEVRQLFIAGHLLALGEEAAVYSADGALAPFAMLPIWAVFASWGVQLLPFGALKLMIVATAPVLLAGSVWIAARPIEARDVSTTMMTAVGCVAMLFVLPGTEALASDQSAILAGFLTVAAIERSQSKVPLVAGLALAGATSLSIHVALLAPLWLVAGRWRETAVFLCTCAIVLSLSVAVAGAPMHEDYLAALEALRLSPTEGRWSLDAMLGTWAWPEAAIRPDAWQMTSAIVMAATLAFTTLAITGRERIHVLTWPVALTALTFVTPYAGPSAYLPALAFMPHLLDRFGLRTGGLVIIGCALPLTLAGTGPVALAPEALNLPVVLGSLSLLALSILFVATIRERAQPEPRPQVFSDGSEA